MSFHMAFTWENVIKWKRRADAVRYMYVPAGIFGARRTDSHGHRPQEHLDLRKHAKRPALRP